MSELGQMEMWLMRCWSAANLGSVRGDKQAWRMLDAVVALDGWHCSYNRSFRRQNRNHTHPVPPSYE